MRKIFFLTSTLHVGGAEKMLAEIIRNLNTARFNKILCCLYEPGRVGETLIKQNIDVRYSLLKNKYDLIGLYKLYRLLKREHPDLLYVESSPLTLFWGFICGRLLGIPGIITFIHGMDKPRAWARFKSSMIHRLILPGLDRIAVVSAVKFNKLRHEYRLDPSKVVLINNAIDISKFKLKGEDISVIKQKIGVSENETLVGMVGRLVYEKAYDIFLRSAREIVDFMPECKFLIAGDGEERPYLEKLADNLGIRQRIIFLGECDNVPEIISALDVAVLSSRIESFPLVLLEYMAASKPIVATDAGGNSEIIRHMVSGVIVPPEDPGSLARAINMLLKDKEMAKALGNMAGREVEQKFSLEKMMEKIESFFLYSGRYTNRKRNVVIVGPALEVRGGISSFAKNYLRAACGGRFRLFYHPTTIDGDKALKILFFIKSLTSFLIKLALNQRIKIVHICSSSRGSFYRKAIILIVSKIFMKKTVFHIHGAGFDLFYKNGGRLSRFLIRKILNLSDAVLVLSTWWYSKISYMTDNTNIKIIPNPIDTRDFEVIRDRRDFARLNILTAGRLEQRKGTYDLLDAVTSIIKEVPGAKFYIAGDGDIEGTARLCRSKGIEKYVVLLGWLDRDRLLKVMEKVSIFLLPSYHEGFPMAILEAMASGLPVVSTRVGGIPDMVDDGVNGFLLEPGQKHELAERVIRLLKDPFMRSRMGRNNIKKIESTFKAELLVDRFFDEYNRLISSPAKASFSWYIKRLSCMSIPEIVYRIAEFMQTNFQRYASKNIELTRVMDRRKKGSVFYFNPARAQNIRQEFIELFPHRIDSILTEADLICRHKFRIFSQLWDGGQKLDWHRDPVTGKRWPLKYWADIDFRNDCNLMESRFVWEFNRHQHLVTLGIAFILTQKIKYAREIKDQILSWIAQNPPYMGINWTSPLELSLRIISWCWAYKFIDSSEVFSPEEKDEFLKSVYLQVKFINGHLSRYSSANNHLIGEACGLIITGLAFPEFRHSEDWVSRGKEILFRELLRQVYVDGVTKEQALYYQGFVMELFSLASLLLIKNGTHIPEKVMERFLAMNEFIMNVMDIKGNIPDIGDSDNARAIRLREGQVNIFKSMLSSACIFFQRGDFKTRGCGFEEEHYWLFGREGYEKFLSIGSYPPELDSRLFRKGGYAIFRKSSGNGRERLLVMDCGELGYSSLAAHAHADLMNLVLSADGVKLLIDPGTYLYHTGNSWRDYFRSTRAHNTLTVNEKNQCEIKGPFIWGRERPSPRIEKWGNFAGGEYIRVSYTNSSFSHTRSITFNKNRETWLIEDLVNAKGKKNTVRQYFHFSSRCLISVIYNHIVEAQNQGLFLYVWIDPEFSIDIKKGELSPIIGWSSDMFGAKVKSPAIVNTAVIEDRGVFKTYLYVSDIRLNPRSLSGIFSDRHTEAL